MRRPASGRILLLGFALVTNVTLAATSTIVLAVEGMT